MPLPVVSEETGLLDSKKGIPYRRKKGMHFASKQSI
jgi:hypothetical protein